MWIKREAWRKIKLKIPVYGSLSSICESLERIEVNLAIINSEVKKQAERYGAIAEVKKIKSISRIG